MRSTQKGSAILIVILVMSAVTIICINIWRATVLTADFSYKRQAREQKFQIAQGVLNYGIALCKDRFKILEQHTTKGEAIELDVGSWKIDDHISYKGKLVVVPKGNSVHLQASIIEGSSCGFSLGCQLHQKTVGSGKDAVHYFQISNWDCYT